MPVIHVRALPQKPGVDVTNALAKATAALAKAANIEGKRVWGTWETLAPGHFVENAATAEVQPDATHPPLVDILAFEGRPPEMVERMIVGVVHALGEALQVPPANFFVTYRVLNAGQVWTGGALKR